MKEIQEHTHGKEEEDVGKEHSFWLLNCVLNYKSWTGVYYANTGTSQAKPAGGGVAVVVVVSCSSRGPQAHK